MENSGNLLWILFSPCLAGQIWFVLQCSPLTAEPVWKLPIPHSSQFSGPSTILTVFTAYSHYNNFTFFIIDFYSSSHVFQKWLLSSLYPCALRLLLADSKCQMVFDKYIKEKVSDSTRKGRGKYVGHKHIRKIQVKI